MKPNKTFLINLTLIFSLIDFSYIATSYAADAPPSASISGAGIDINASIDKLREQGFSTNFKQTNDSKTFTRYNGNKHETAISAIALKPGRNTADQTVPRLAQGNSPKNAPKNPGGSIAGTACATNQGNGGAGRMVSIPLPVGDIEGTGSFDTADVGNLACIPANVPAGEAVEVIDEVTGETVEVEPIVITVSAEDFENQPIQPAVLHMDNAPHTLKNYNTNIYAQAGEQVFTENVLGEDVQIRAIPVSYTFDYGDGTVLTTTHPGFSVGQGWDVRTATSHQYGEVGDYSYTVSTTYRGEFRVSGGPWQVIAGTSDRQSVSAVVQVWRVRSGNVAGSCVEDSEVAGCPGTKK